MNIAIVGSTGFIGRNLIDYLLKNTNHNIYAFCKKPDSLPDYSGFSDRLKVFRVDVFDTKLLKEKLIGVDLAYYLVHMMADNSIDFYSAEKKAAHSFGISAEHAGVKRVIYLGGLGKDDKRLSKHLKSRHETGNILRSYKPLVIELRASIIVGEGSISFEIIRNLVKKLYIIPLPRHSKNVTQPIGIGDVLEYLKESIYLNISSNEIIEIGGPEVMSYKDFIASYAKFINKKCILIRIPLAPTPLIRFFLYLFTSKNMALVGSNMVDSFKNEVIVSNKKAENFFPNIKTKLVKYFYF